MGDLLAERPGLSAALASTLRDLRDAGVPPPSLPDAVSDLREVAHATQTALQALERRGWIDRIGLFQRAARGAPLWARRMGFESVEVHGATELVGSAGDLIDALAAVVPVRMLQPDWGGAFASEVRTTWPWRFRPEPVEVIDDPALPPDGQPPPGVLRSHRLANPREEAAHVAREILRLCEAGADPSQICVVSRRIDPYAPWLETELDRHGIAFTSSMTRPAAREPAVRDWIDRLAPALVVAATDDAAVNAAAESAALDANALVNRTDVSAADRSGGRGAGSVVVPATIEDDPVRVALSTGGASPALAKRCEASYIDREPRTWERPSDHTPVVAEFRV